MIEVELRSLIAEEKYKELVDFFEKNADNKGIQKQITGYFSGQKDFRLMTTDQDFCQLWLKKGQMHQDAREEMVVKFDKNYKEALLNMFQELGFSTKIKWYRVRKSFWWNQIEVTLDFTYGYGYIVEFETLVEDESQIESAKENLKSLFSKLNVNITEKEVFKEKFLDYEHNWQEYTKGLNDDLFFQMK